MNVRPVVDLFFPVSLALGVPVEATCRPRVVIKMVYAGVKSSSFSEGLSRSFALPKGGTTLKLIGMTR